MAKFPIPQYIAQNLPDGGVRGNFGSSADPTGLVRGLAGAADTMQRLRTHEEQQRFQIQQQQDAENKKLAHDEALITVTNTMSKAHSDWTEKLSAAKQAAPAGAPGFTAQTMGEFDTWAEKAVAEAPEMGRKVLQQRLAEFRTQMHGKAFEYEQDARNTKLIGDYETGLDADRRTVMADPSQFPALLASRLATVNTLTLPANLKAKASEVTRERLANDAATGLVDRNPDAFLQRAGIAGAKTGKDGKPLPSDPAKAAEAVKADPILSQMKPEDLQRAVERATMLKVQRDAQRQAEADRAAARAEMFAAKREREASQAYTILSDWARDGKLPDPVASKPLLDKLAGTPYAAAYQARAQDVAKNAAAAMLPLSSQQAQLDMLMSQRNKGGTSQGLESEIKARENILKATQADLERDAPAALLERGLIKDIPPIDISRPETLRARADLMSMGETFAGKPVSPLRPQEAAAMSQMMAKLAPAEKEAVVKQVMTAMGAPAAMALFRQVGKDAPLLAVAGGLAGQQTSSRSHFLGMTYGQEQRRSVSQLMFEGEALLTNKQVNMPEAAAFNAEFLNYVGNSIPNPEARAMAITATGAIYAKLAFEAGKFNEKSVDTGLLRQAASFVTGRVIEHNGSKILPPGYGMQESQARDMLKSITPAQVKAWGGVVGMSDEQAAEYIRSAPLESQAIGKYRVLAGSGILQRKDGKPFEMRF